jgi:diguanylate cyclase (GGDEF)-like protein
MYQKLAHLLRQNVDLLSESWTQTLATYYPGIEIRDVFRKVRATHLLFVRSLIENDFSYLYKNLQNEFREWILLKNSFRDIMSLEPVYVMLLEEFIRERNLSDDEKQKLIEGVDRLRRSALRDDLNQIYVGEQEGLFSRQIDELEVLNDISGTDLVGEDSRDPEIDGMLSSARTPRELLAVALEKAMKVLGATDGVLAYRMNSRHEVAVRFMEAPDQRDREEVIARTLEDPEEQFDPRVLTAFSHVVDRAVLRNYWNPELIDDLRTQNCPSCPFKDELMTSVRGSIDCPILRSLRVNSFICHQLGQNGEKGFFLLSRSFPPPLSPEDLRFLETLAASMMTIIKNYQLYEKQKELATIDGMTGLYNHRFFQEALGREVSRSQRYGAMVSLLYMDIDHFKLFNDKYGHQVGDEVLKIVARTIRRNLRDSDVPCRYGGEELVAILPDTPLEGAAAAGEKIRKAVESLRLPVNDQSVKITISAGAAMYPLNATDKQTLIEAADGALYQAKQGGRNQVRLSNVDPYKKEEAAETEVESKT